MRKVPSRGSIYFQFNAELASRARKVVRFLHINRAYSSDCFRRTAARIRALLPARTKRNSSHIYTLGPKDSPIVGRRSTPRASTEDEEVQGFMRDGLARCRQAGTDGRAARAEESRSRKGRTNTGRIRRRVAVGSEGEFGYQSEVEGDTRYPEGDL